MTESGTLSGWLPDRQPSWSDLAIALVLTLTWVPIQVSTLETVSWSALAVGFLTMAVLLGPVATTSVATRFEDWGRSVGVVRRVLVLLAVVVALFLVGAYVAPQPIVMSFVVGGVSAGLAVIWTQLLRYRSVSSWW